MVLTIPDEQLVLFLYEKVVHGRSPSENNLHEFPRIYQHELYGLEEPWQVWKWFPKDDDDQEDLYLFTKVKKMIITDINGLSWTIRKVGPNYGTWSASKSQIILGGKTNTTTPSFVARKTELQYHNPGCPDQNGQWFMHEFSLDHLHYHHHHHQIVLCRLTRKKQCDQKPTTTMEIGKKKIKFDMSTRSTKSSVLEDEQAELGEFVHENLTPWAITFAKQLKGNYQTAPKSNVGDLQPNLGYKFIWDIN